MYIHSRTRGTNQYGVKAELKECVICKSCGAFNDEYKPRKQVNGFYSPARQKTTNCHNCNELLNSPLEAVSRE